MSIWIFGRRQAERDQAVSDLMLGLRIVITESTDAGVVLSISAVADPRTTRFYVVEKGAEITVELSAAKDDA